MSKQSEAKEAQNYRKTSNCCGNCIHYASTIIEKQYKSSRDIETWNEEKEKRCGIGNFAVIKTGACDKHELTPNALT